MTTTRDAGGDAAEAHQAGQVPGPTMVALISAVFTVSVAYGIVLPLLPEFVGRLTAGDTGSAVAQHTGLLTGAYAFALFLGAPVWGRLSDLYGRRNLLLVGLFGFGAATLAFSVAGSLTGAYLQRVSSGLFAAAITPLASATIADLSSADERRGRRLAFLSMASIAGFLLGPTLGVFAARTGAAWLGPAAREGPLVVPLASAAALAALVGVLVARAVPNRKRILPRPRRPDGSGRARGPTVMRLLVLTFVVSAGVGVFEVGLALRGTQQLGLTPYQVALMFTECSLIMFTMQAIVFSPLIGADRTRRLLAPGLLAFVAGLLLVPLAASFWLLVAVIAGVATSAGIVAPLLTYWISVTAGDAQGWELGRQVAAASLGVTVGSAAGGLLFTVGAFSGGAFVLAGSLVAVGYAVSLGLPRALGDARTADAG